MTMTTTTVDTIIIGGGLSGLYAAYLLSQKNIPFLVLEARERIGGRILTTEHSGYFPDMGPSWYWPEINPKLIHLIQALGLKGYRQFEEGLGRFEHANGRVQTVIRKTPLATIRTFRPGLQSTGTFGRNS